MGRPRRVTCRRCDRHISICGKLSARGFCIECGIGNAVRQNKELHEMQGESLEKWREAVARSIGATLPPKPPPNESDGKE